MKHFILQTSRRAESVLVELIDIDLSEYIVGKLCYSYKAVGIYKENLFQLLDYEKIQTKCLHIAIFYFTSIGFRHCGK